MVPAGSVERNAPNMIRFAQRLPSRRVGNEKPSFFGIAVKALRGVHNIMTMKIGLNGMGRDRGKEFVMLSLQLRDGEYITIGKDIVIQVFTGTTTQMLVQAPRDMTILRGEVLERNGEARPACLYGQSPEKMKKAAKHNSVSNG